MGAVQIVGADPFRHSIIGVAPLILGSIAVLLIGQGWLNLGRIGQALTTGNLDALSQALTQTLALPDVWLWLYLLFAISNAMLPSSSDRESWRTVLIYLGLALLLALGLGLNPTLFPDLQLFGVTILTYLLSAFVITIAVDLFFIVVIFVIESTLALVSGQRVQYHRH